MSIETDIRPVTYLKAKASDLLMKLIHQSEEAIRQGKVTSHDDVFRELNQRLDRQ